MAGEKMEKTKKKMVEGATSISSGKSTVAKDGARIKAQLDEFHDTKGDEPMTEEKMGNLGAKWVDAFMGMMDNVPAFTTSNKAMEPFVELTKMQQQNFTNMYQVWSAQLGKIGEASRSGDVKKVMETWMESNKEILDTCQAAMKEEAAARYELLRTIIPALPGFTGTRSQ